jgi:hypothetical protein
MQVIVVGRSVGALIRGGMITQTMMNLSPSILKRNCGHVSLVEILII